MSATVRATCPGCKNVVRIPSAWADRAVKCKRCGAVMRGKPKAPAAEPTRPTTAVAAQPTPPVIAPPVAADPPPPQPVPGYVPLPAYPAAPGYPYPQPGYAYPPAAGYPAYPYAVPPGQPLPPGYIPGYAYPPQPAPGYPAVDPAFPAGPVLVDEPSPFATPGIAPRRRRRQSSLATVAGVSFVLLLVVGAVGGAWYYSPEIKAKFAGAKADDPGAVADSGEPKAGPGKTAVGVSAAFPRRMLVVSVSKYLYCNALAADAQAAGGSTQDHVTAVAKRLAYEWRVPTDKDNNQLYVLSDSAKKDARPMLKPIIQEAVAQFCQTSRPQDRVVIYFGGHAVEKDDKAYLIPVDGDPADPATLIPLDDLWAALKECKAQQKVVLFDVCRLNEDGDQVRPGSEPMTDALERKLLAAPPGVQAVTSCSVGQNALEFRRVPRDADDVAGSLFLSALRYVANKKKPAGQPRPEDPIPVGPFVEAARVRMKEVAAAAGKPEQGPRLVGSEGPAVSPNPEEAAAKRFDLPAPPKSIPPAELAKIADTIKLPLIRGTRLTADGTASTEDEPLDGVVPFDTKVMAAYKPDGVSVEEIRKEPQKYPIRKAALDALTAIREQWKATTGGAKAGGGLRSEFSGDTNDRVKKEIKSEQETPARIILELEEKVKDMETVMGDLDKEPSKFWRATFLYALAQTKARVAFMHEYDLALGHILTDALPPRDEKKGQTGLQMVSADKMKSKKDIKDIAESARELFGKVAEEHKGTPWAVQAKRAKAIALGLEWRPYNPAGMAAKDE